MKDETHSSRILLGECWISLVSGIGAIVLGSIFCAIGSYVPMAIGVILLLAGIAGIIILTDEETDGSVSHKHSFLYFIFLLA